MMKRMFPLSHKVVNHDSTYRDDSFARSLFPTRPCPPINLSTCAFSSLGTIFLLDESLQEKVDKDACTIWFSLSTMSAAFAFAGILNMFDDRALVSLIPSQVVEQMVLREQQRSPSTHWCACKGLRRSLVRSYTASDTDRMCSIGALSVLISNLLRSLRLS